MKNFISVLSMMVIFGGFVVCDSAADNHVQSGLTAQDSEDVCAWTSYTQTTFQGNCEQIDKNCKQSGSGAGKNGVCKKFNDGSLRCVARECPSGYVMPLVFNDKRDVPAGKDARILGYCYSEQQAWDKCSGNCAGGGTCEPKFVDYQEANQMLKKTSVVKMTGGKAFVGCFCKDCDVPQEVICDDGECEFIGDITVNCVNGSVQSMSVEFKIEKNYNRDKIIEKINKDYGPQMEQLCANSKVDSVGLSDETVVVQGKKTQNNANVLDSGKSDKSDEIKKAREKLDAFFKKVDSDRSVWKNADGSFNAVRLASDLTSGVVLGTVGGVVSGILIKKSQVEKGFDALNCTVGGQKIADWGDEFTVGLRR